ncbi:MAG: DUF1003 domain-containing protein [Deltaproteobacteria bacterium]|nr:DUF1003 domain-containing protein [Deltaproteobacteria bacterium]
MQRNRRQVCRVCGNEKSEAGMVPVQGMRPSLAAEIERDHPGATSEGFLCLADLNHYRSIHIERLLETEKGELSGIDHQVLESIRNLETVAGDPARESDTRRTFGEGLADSVASFGGSWTFLMAFAATMALWILINSTGLSTRPFDPFPYILLNLVLSCLASVQAPVILMSQNRQAARDRLTSEHDYRVNLKAELEIRQIHDKLDHLLAHQWSRLMDIQQIQVDVLRELEEHRRERRGDRAEPTGPQS